MNKITIIDSVMGSGKTSWAIDKIKQDDNNKYVYITPYLSEIDRMKKSITNKKLYEPMNRGRGKLESLHKLLNEGKDIASTHALFKISNSVTKELIQSEDYILILDEVMDLIEIISLKKNDLEALTNLKLISIEEDGKVMWHEDKIDFESKYDDIKEWCLNGSLYYINGILFIWTFPIDIFNVFKEVYVLTYLFDGQIQKYYYDLNNIEYTYKSIKNSNSQYVLCDYIGIHGKQFKELIDIVENDKLNALGLSQYSLSKSWFNKEGNQALVERLKRNLQNYYINITKSKSKDNLWTTFKDYKSKLAAKGFTKGFVSCNMRATNDYADKVNLAYCCNIFMNPVIKNFFINKSVEIDEDLFALSELIQWIWRSRIRKDEKINLYIPSLRMRNLLKNYLNL